MSITSSEIRMGETYGYRRTLVYTCGHQVTAFNEDCAGVGVGLELTVRRNWHWLTCWKVNR